MNIAGNEHLLHSLAAEYALGTLKGGARRRYETLLRNDAVIQRVTAAWQDRLAPMAQLTTSELPPTRIWTAIAANLGFAAQKSVPSRRAQTVLTGDKRSFWLGLRDDLSFWRGLGMVSTALATVLIAVLATRQPDSGAIAPSYVAMLSNDQAQSVAVITGDVKNHRLTVKLLNNQVIASDRSLELWAIPKTGGPRSLGLIEANRSVTLNFPDDTTPQSVTTLAVSLEPKGGSPDRSGPTGPVIYKGAWVQL